MNANSGDIPGIVLTTRQRGALPKLLAAKTQAAGVEAAGISESTFRRWRREPSFAAEWERAQNEAFAEGLERIQRSCGDAAEKLVALLSCGRPELELAAAREIIAVGVKSRDLYGIENRLRKLEAAHEARSAIA